MWTFLEKGVVQVDDSYVQLKHGLSVRHWRKLAWFLATSRIQEAAELDHA